MFLAQWGLEIRPGGPFMIVMKWKYNETCQFLRVDIYHFQFSLIHLNLKEPGT